MSGLTNYTANGVLGHVTGKAAIFPLRTAYVALFSAAGADDGTGFTELAGAAYARVATAPTDWSTPTGSPALITNVNPIVFPTSTGIWGTIAAFGLYDAASAGNLLAWDYLVTISGCPRLSLLRLPLLSVSHVMGI